MLSIIVYPLFKVIHVIEPGSDRVSIEYPTLKGVDSLNVLSISTVSE